MFRLSKPEPVFETHPQIFDLLQLSRREREYKIRCMQAIRQFDAWKDAQKKSSAARLRLHEWVKGIRLRRRAREAVVFYKMVKDNRMKSFRYYVERLPQRSFAVYSAS